MRRPPVPEWAEVTLTIPYENAARYPADYLERSKEHMFIKLLRDTRDRGFKWLDWPTFTEDEVESFIGSMYKDTVIRLGVWAVPA